MIMIEINNDTDILFVKSKGSVNKRAMSAYHTVLRHIVDNYIAENQARQPKNSGPFRMDLFRDRFMLQSILVKLKEQIPNVRFITKKDNELIEISDEENIKTKLWQRVKMRAQLFRKIQLKEEKRQLKLRMSIQDENNLLTSQPLTLSSSLDLDTLQEQQMPITKNQVVNTPSHCTDNDSDKRNKSPNIQSDVTKKKQRKNEGNINVHNNNSKMTTMTETTITTNKKTRKPTSTTNKMQRTTTTNKRPKITKSATTATSATSATAATSATTATTAKNPTTATTATTATAATAATAATTATTAKNPTNTTNPTNLTNPTTNPTTSIANLTANPTKSSINKENNKTKIINIGDISKNYNEHLNKYIIPKKKEAPIASTPLLTMNNKKETVIRTKMNIGYTQLLSSFELRMYETPIYGNCGIQAILHHLNIENRCDYNIKKGTSVILFRRYLCYNIMKLLMSNEVKQADSNNLFEVMLAFCHEDNGELHNSLYSYKNEKKFKVEFHPSHPKHLEKSHWLAHHLLPLISIILKKSILIYTYKDENPRNYDEYLEYIPYDPDYPHTLNEFITQPEQDVAENKYKELDIKPFPDTIFLNYEYGGHYDMFVSTKDNFYIPQYNGTMALRSEKKQKSGNKVTQFTTSEYFVDKKTYTNVEQQYNEFCKKMNK